MVFKRKRSLVNSKANVKSGIYSSKSKDGNLSFSDPLASTVFSGSSASSSFSAAASSAAAAAAAAAASSTSTGSAYAPSVIIFLHHFLISRAR